MGTIFRRWLVGTALPLLVAGGLEAGALATVEGFVTDAGGAGVPRARVTLASPETGERRTVVTDRRGLYVATAMTPGRYDVSASRAGTRSVLRQGLRLWAGERLRLDLRLAVEDGEIPTAALGNQIAGAAGVRRLDHSELVSLPSLDRDFADLARALAIVRGEVEAGRFTLGGQRAGQTGRLVDGMDGKSDFTGDGRGGAARLDGGPVLALDSLAEVQALTDGYSADHGDGGGTLNLITRRGGNQVGGSAFFRHRNDSRSASPRRSPLDRFLGRDRSPAAKELERETYGGSLGAPLWRDRTHLFLSWDEAERVEAASRELGRGTYDALRLRALADPRFAGLLFGWQPGDDGAVAADAVLGRTARQDFERRADNEIFLARLDHRFGDAHSGFLKLDSTAWELLSGNPDEESIQRQETRTLAARLVSVIGSRATLAARLQLAADDLDRRSARMGQFIEAEIVFADSGDVVGKTAGLPIRTEETKAEVGGDFSYLAGGHELMAGFEVRRDDARHLLAPGRDGSYRFDTLGDFVAGQAAAAEIYFGAVDFPNYDASRELYAFYLQDRWRPGRRWSVDFGLRLGATLNPDGFEHLFAEGRQIPDDTDNLAPRLRFAWTPDAGGRSLVRGGAGLFFARAPASLFALQARRNGLYPNLGRVVVAPGEIGFVELGEPIDSRTPPPGIAAATGFVDPRYEDAEIFRAGVGYEREFLPGWSLSADLVYADGDHLLENVDLNRVFTLDAAGRPITLPDRPLTRGDVTGTGDETPLGEVLVRQSIGESEYRAVVLAVDKRFSGRYRLRAHYTYSEDRDTSSMDRAAAEVTLSRPDHPRFDFGYSDRDVRHRLVVSGVAELPLDFTVSGIFELRGGTPFNPVGSAAGACGLDPPAFDCPDARPVVDGRVVARNSERNGSFATLDLRLGKFFEFGDRYRADAFVEVFNVFDEQAFEVDGSPLGVAQRQPGSDQFGLASQPITGPRQVQLGVRFTY